MRASFNETKKELIKSQDTTNVDSEANVNLQDELIKNEQSLQLKETPSEGWKALQQKLLEAELPAPREKPKKPEVKRLRGFKLYRNRETGEFSMQLAMLPKTEGAQILLSSVVKFLERVTGKDVKYGLIDGWSTDSVDLEEKVNDIKEIALLMQFEEYKSPHVGHKWFLEQLFKLTHMRMLNKNYEVAKPSGNCFTSWILRDIIRLFGRIRYEVLRQFVLRIPLKERMYMKLRFHDFEKFKSVLSEQEWSAIGGHSLVEESKECAIIKSSLVSFKQELMTITSGTEEKEVSRYVDFQQSNAQTATEFFGKSSLALIYQRIKERNTLKLAAIKRKENPNIPLRTVLQSLIHRHMYAGVHMLPVILKYRPGDLPIIQTITTITSDGIVANDRRFGDVETYLRFAREHPTRGADAGRVVEVDLSVGFPTIEQL